MVNLADPIFTDNTAAREHLEALLWANGRFCPHCGATEGTSPVLAKSHRAGLYYCNACKKQFTVTVGTVFERSKVALHKWVLAFHLLSSSKKGMSAHQLHRMLGVTYKTAWFMAHRIREAMGDPSPAPTSERVVLRISCPSCRKATEKALAWLIGKDGMPCGACGNLIDLKVSDNAVLIEEFAKEAARIEASLHKPG